MWALDKITLRPEVLIYVVNLAVVASLVCGLNLLAVWACRKRSAPLRYNILASGLAFTLLCPVAAWLGQHYGSGLVAVRVADRPPLAADVTIEKSGSVSSAFDAATTDKTTGRLAEVLSSEPTVFGSSARPAPAATAPTGGTTSCCPVVASRSGPMIER